jgi:hypothetical protein
MSDKDLNAPMNREQFETPRELTAEELELVGGGPIYIKYGSGNGNSTNPDTGQGHGIIVGPPDYKGWVTH